MDHRSKTGREEIRGQNRGRGSNRGGRGRGGQGGRGEQGGRGGQGGRGAQGGRGGGRVPIQIFQRELPSHADVRLSNKEQNALVSRFKTLSTSVADRVVRPGFGKEGTVIALRANFFALNYPKNMVLYDYPIEIEPSVKQGEKRLRKRLFDLFESAQEVAPLLHGLAHDRMQRIISQAPLPQDFSTSVAFYEEGESGPRPGGEVYRISVLEPKVLNTADLDR